MAASRFLTAFLPAATRNLDRQATWRKEDTAEREGILQQEQENQRQRDNQQYQQAMMSLQQMREKREAKEFDYQLGRNVTRDRYEDARASKLENEIPPQAQSLWDWTEKFTGKGGDPGRVPEYIRKSNLQWYGVEAPPKQQIDVQGEIERARYALATGQISAQDYFKFVQDMNRMSGPGAAPAQPVAPQPTGQGPGPFPPSQFVTANTQPGIDITVGGGDEELLLTAAERSILNQYSNDPNIAVLLASLDNPNTPMDDRRKTAVVLRQRVAKIEDDRKAAAERKATEKGKAPADKYRYWKPVKIAGSWMYKPQVDRSGRITPQAETEMKANPELKKNYDTGKTEFATKTNEGVQGFVKAIDRNVGKIIGDIPPADLKLISQYDSSGQWDVLNDNVLTGRMAHKIKDRVLKGVYPGRKNKHLKRGKTPNPPVGELHY